MFDVSHKPDTLRQATAQAIIKVSPSTINLINKGTSPKGNIIDAARVSATLAAKRTSDLIPYCHPIPIDNIKVDVTIEKDRVVILVQTTTVWKTGVEMESLTAASIAALTIYDMLKPMDELLSIESIRLLRKRGGLHEYNENYTRKLKASVLITSDSRNKTEDESGKLIIKKLTDYSLEVVDYAVVPDDMGIIESELKRICDQLKVDLLITSGGTGIGPRDVTPEASIRVIEKELVGVAEALRAHGQKRTPLSMLSRGVAGVRQKTVIVNLPGSATAVSESLDLLFPAIMHVFKILQGHSH